MCIFSLYIVFTRQPDIFDGIHTEGIIHYAKDSTGKTVPEAFFSIDHQSISFNADYLFRNLKENEKVKIIYDPSQPQKAALYGIWGYWLRWGELLASLVLLIGLFKISKAITSHPTPEGLLSELEEPRPRRRKYS
ncbi:MAG: hypothetical protein ACTHJ5_13630 [Ilyomonas sp.]